MLRFGTAILGLLSVSATSYGGEPAWPTASYAYVVVDQDLRSVLQEFGSNLGLRLALSDGVQGRVRGRLPELPPRQFLDHLAQAYGLDWYYDGLVIAVSAVSEAATRFVPLQGFTVAALEDGLRTAGLLDTRFPVRPGPAGDVATVSGPPRYVDIVRQSLAAMVANRAPSPAAAQVPTAPPATLVVFRGSSASRVGLP